MISMENITKKALVTGAGTGIGSQIAITLAKEGYDVAIHCRGSFEGAENVKKQVEAFGRKAVIVCADLSKVEEIRQMFCEYDKAFGKIDLLVNNAGVTMKSTFLETTEETFDKICDVDYKGAYFVMQEAAKRMVKNNTKGSIVVISSNNSIAHFADVSVYGSAKAAVSKLAEHVAIELAKYGIRVNTVAPGWVDTGASRLDDKESTFYKIPLKKWATMEEVAQSVVYLASDAASSITGTTLVMDNGALLLSDKAERYGL